MKEMAPAGFFEDGGKMGALIRTFDWSATPLGCPADWPQVLQTLIGLMLSSSQPMFVVWGPERTTIYNDAYCEILADKHPALGQPFDRIWHEIWDRDLKPIVESAYAGEALHMDDIPLLMLRRGYPEETHFSFSYTPVRDGTGAVQGFFCPCLETTDKVLEERRARLRAELTERLRAGGDPAELAFDAAGLLARHLRAEQAAYAAIDEAGEHALIARDWNDGRMPSNVGRHRLVDFGPAFVADLKAGRSVAISDARTDPRTAIPEGLTTFARHGIRAFLDVPHVRDGRLVAVLAVHAGEPRHWHPADIALAEEVTERVSVAIERTQAEAAMRESETALRESEEHRGIALESGGMGAWRWDTRARLVRSDEAFQRLWGVSHGDRLHPVSTYTDLMHPEGAAAIEAVIAKELVPGAEFSDQVQVAAGPAAGRWVQWRGRAERDRPWIVNGVSFDITEQRLAQQKVRQSEERLRKVLDIRTVGVVFFDLVGGIRDANDAFLAMIGYSRAELEAGELRYENMTPPGWRWRDERTIAELRTDGRAGPFEKEYIRKDGSVIWILCADNLLDEHIAVEFVIDVTEPKRAEEALSRSEARFRALVSSTSNIVYRMSPDWAEMLRLEGRGFIPDTAEPRENWQDAYIAPEDQPTVAATIREAIRAKGMFDLEHRVRRANGSLGWVHSRAVPLLDGDGAIVEWFGAASDVTERKRAEQRQAMLMAELDHRVKNVLAVVQSIARLSLRKEGAAGPEAVEGFLGRLSALAQSHTLLARSRWEGARLRDLVQNALAPYRGGRVERVRASGPDLQVTPKAAQTLALALHELVTNAAKYGALSVEEGRVAVEWQLLDAGDEERLLFHWSEHDGPPVEKPLIRRGFGSLLIEKSLTHELGGEVALDYSKDGLRAAFDLPLRELRVRCAGHGAMPHRGNPASPNAGERLDGRKILVAEDEHLVADEVVEALREAGCAVIGPVATLSRALHCAEAKKLDAAVLDLNLKGELVWPVARMLLARAIPFVFATGYSETIGIPPELTGVEWFEKPVDPRHLIATLAALVAAE